MTNLDPSVAKGHYASKQLSCKARLIAWSHRRRFQTSLALASKCSGKRVLDYGAGDGTFVAMLGADSMNARTTVGAELCASLVEDCRARLGDRPGLSFVLISDLDLPEHAGAYDVVICMEVLEHVVDVEPLLERFVRLLAPSGKLIVSVPVEMGLALLVKQIVRRIAGWRRLGDYPGTASYSLRELWAGLFAGQRQHIPRPVYTAQDGSQFHDHKGFNWKLLRGALARRFEIEQTLTSPLPWLPPQMATQVWFVASKNRRTLHSAR